MSSRDKAGIGDISTRAAKREEAARVGGDVNRVRAGEHDRQDELRRSDTSTADHDPASANTAAVVPAATGLPIAGGDLLALASTFRAKKPPAKEQWGTQLPPQLVRRINLARRILDVQLTDLTERVWTEWLDGNGLPRADENGNPITASE